MTSSRAATKKTIPVNVKVGRDGNDLLKAHFEKLEKEGIKLKVVMRWESAEAVKEFVRNGAGVGFLYYSSIKRGIERGEFQTITVPGPSLIGRNFSVYSKDKPLTPLAKALLEFLRSIAPTFLPARTANR